MCSCNCVSSFMNHFFLAGAQEEGLPEVCGKVTQSLFSPDCLNHYLQCRCGLLSYTTDHMQGAGGTNSVPPGDSANLQSARFSLVNFHLLFCMMTHAGLRGCDIILCLIYP